MSEYFNSVRRKFNFDFLHGKIEWLKELSKFRDDLVFFLFRSRTVLPVHPVGAVKELLVGQHFPTELKREEASDVAEEPLLGQLQEEERGAGLDSLTKCDVGR